MDTVVCPECGEEYSKNGLYGHLMGHGLGGEELEGIYQEALGTGGDSGSENESASVRLPDFDGERDDQETEKSNDEARQPLAELPDPPSQERGREEREPSATGVDEVERAADRLCRAKERLRMVEEETGEVRREEVSKGGLVSRIVSNSLGKVVPALSRTETREEVRRTEAEQEHLEKCREAVEKAEREYRKALKKRQAEHDYG